MEQYIIKGGHPLVGEVEIGGAKNAALAILAAAIMTDETVLIDNLPDVNDINVLIDAIEGIGAQVHRVDRHTVKINGASIKNVDIEYDYIKKIRASYYLLGALLGKYRRAEVALPGGCNIGSRPIDQHLKGFRALGADVDIEHRRRTYHSGKCCERAARCRRCKLPEQHGSQHQRSRYRRDQDPWCTASPQHRIFCNPRPDRSWNIHVRGSSYQGRCNGTKCYSEAFGSYDRKTGRNRL